MLLVGADSNLVALFKEHFGQEVALWVVSSEDSLTREMLNVADVVVVMAKAEFSTERFRNLLLRITTPAVILFTGNREPYEALRKDFPLIRFLQAPIDFSYLRGVLDSSELDRARIQQLGKEHNRLTSLYELSSSLLRVSDFGQLEAALDPGLPKMLETSLTLLTFPAWQSPVVFKHAPGGLSSRRIAMLSSHLRDAWDVLRPDKPLSWDWLLEMEEGDVQAEDRHLKPWSFMSVPINRGSELQGFMTLLPKNGQQVDEVFLQTVFVLTDLLGVVIQNLDLRTALEQRANVDGLTGLLNRMRLLDQVEMELRRAARSGVPLCLVMVDVDHFKLVNDTRGHQAGDEVLRQVAQILRTSSREVDLVGRFGGEEFLVCLIESDESGGHIWAERTRKRIEELVVTYQGRDIQVTCSFGVAAHESKEETAPRVLDLLIAHADRSLYEAKRLGRNRVITHSSLPKEEA